MLQINPSFPYGKLKRFMNSWNDVLQLFFAILELALGKYGIISCQNAFLPLYFKNRLEERKKFKLSSTSTWSSPEIHLTSCSWTFFANRTSENLNAIYRDIASPLSKRSMSLHNAFHSSM